MDASLDRPVFIIASPRSGSTLLYETLARHPEFVSLHAESHAVIEHIPALSTAAQGFVSNALDASHASKEIKTALTHGFLSQAKHHDGARLSGNAESVRFLEKTPKNSLRVKFLHALYPDARFIYLVREPVANIASIMEAWRSGRFITYPRLPDWKGPWSLLLPPNWRTLAGKPLADIATYQWEQANLQAVNAFLHIDSSQILTVNYDTLVANPTSVINTICEFADVDTSLLNVETLPLSKFTLSAPSSSKWHRHAAAIAQASSNLQSALSEVNALLEAHQMPGLQIHPQLETVAEHQNKARVNEQKQFAASVQPSSRNAVCSCGSGKRYKHCHGKLF